MVSPYRRGYADGPYGQVHFVDTGGEGRPLVLLHQAPQSSKQFDSVYPKLAERGIRAIGVDMPGFGMSDKTDFTPRVEDYARAIPAVLDHLGVAKADILGHHTGALVATEVSLQFPDRIENLIMNGPVPLEDEERARFMKGVDREKAHTAREDGSHLTSLFFTRARMANGTVDLNIVTRYVVEALMGYGPFWYGHHAAFVYDHNSAIPKITHRTLILTNTGDQIYEHAKWTKRMRPDFEIAVLDGGGIDIVDQMPDEWADAVKAFLRPAG